MARDFYPYVEEGAEDLLVSHPARIAVYDDAAAAPRVVVIEAAEIRSYLEELTREVYTLARDAGGELPFMVVREIIENFIHAEFMSPTISILDHGNTIRFTDQGPGIEDKGRALEYGTTSATEDMKRYIRGVGSGLPYVQQYMADKGGSLTIEDNVGTGTIVTISTKRAEDALVHAEEKRDEQPRQASVRLSERSEQALSYLSAHELGGPNDLVRSYGQSAPTWSRELKALVAVGYVHKVGQKYALTQAGQAAAISS